LAIGETFTGADREKRGAFDDADGGFLFLDEVHRLSAAGKPGKTFLFMDKGYFYRLGDNRTPPRQNTFYLRYD
jgi:transcriptional regulator with AAA-type ATPase domain